MPADSNKYRDHLYRYREHPSEGVPEDFVDQRDSFFSIYLSVIPFLALEYFAEVSFKVIPTGVVFPVGFLLFWAFYYTYYKPGFLESRLSNTEEWDFMSIPTILVGVLVWFVKVTVVNLMNFCLRYLGVDVPQKQKPKVRRVTPPPLHQQRPRYRAQSHARPQAKRPEPPKEPPLPPSVREALTLLGIPECRSWDAIHHRYRELAKQYHPDLNPDLTDVGRRFMMYDSAYRTLSQVRTRYFRK